VGSQLRVFQSLAATASTLTIAELAAPTGADPAMVNRVLRYLAANRMVAAAGPGRYAASKSTRFLAEPGIEGGATFFQGVVSPATHHLPASQLAKNGFANTPDNEPLVFHEWAGTSLDLYPWLKTQPDQLAAFQRLMTVDRGGDWLGCVEFPDASSSSLPSADGGSSPIVFVDVGGNVGHQSKRLLARHPHLAGRIVVQDLPETVAAAPPTKGLTFAAHDFFTPQPVRGARYYYLRSILHNWGDARAEAILRALVPALRLAPPGVHSRVLLDELVVPDTGADAWVAGQDLNMMLLFGGMERTRGEWAALLDRAGLRMVEVKTYVPVRGSSIIVAELK
jgi:hypothetical protein